jgi:hypothetical protein
MWKYQLNGKWLTEEQMLNLGYFATSTLNPLPNPTYCCDWCNKPVVQSAHKKLKKYCSISHKQMAYQKRTRNSENP